MAEDEQVEMVVVDGVRYRPDDAPKQEESERDEKPAQNKMRQTRTAKKSD